MAQANFVDEYLSILQSRLKDSYEKARTALIQHRIPYEEDNPGLFVITDLSSWLWYFEGSSLGNNSREIQLCQYLIDHGVFLNAGEVSHSRNFIQTRRS